jgi:hypothetical protein
MNGSSGSPCAELGTITFTKLNVLYSRDDNFLSTVKDVEGSFSLKCEGTVSDALEGTFSYNATTLNATNLSTSPTGAKGPAQFTAGQICRDALNSGGAGGIPGTGGGSGGGTSIGVFPGFGGFGRGAPGGSGSGGGSGGTSTPILNLTLGFDMNNGIPSLAGTDELDLPLILFSAGLKDKVTLSASADPDGLDLSFDNPTPSTDNRFTLPILIIKPHADAQPRDYVITVTAQSGDTKSSTSFLVSLTCNTPFIASMASSQPQSQTISSGSTATLSVSAIGTGPFSFQWYRGATGNTQFPVDGATGRQFTTPALTNTETYWVRVSNPCGTADSNAATITVQ